MQFAVLITVFLLFQGSFFQKLASFICTFLTICLVEVGNGYLILLMLIPCTEIPLGVFFYLKVVPLMKDFLSFFTIKTCLLLGLPVMIPVLAQGLVFEKYNTPYFPVLVALYWILCFASYPLFFLGIRYLHKQEEQKLHQSRQLELVTKQLECSKEMEQEYQELRKWNHDVQKQIPTVLRY